MVAQAAALGLDDVVLAIIQGEDRVERIMLEGVLERASRLAELRDRHLAQKIAAEVSKIFKG